MASYWGSQLKSLNSNTMIRNLILIVLPFVLQSSQILDRKFESSQRTPPPDKVLSRLAAGVNVDHWLSHRDSVEIKDIKGYLPPSEKDFMKSMGIKMIRLPFVQRAISDSDSGLPLNEAKCKAVESEIRELNRRGIFVILDFHPKETFGATLNDPKNATNFIEFWKAVATRFSKISDSNIAFEVLNEPTTGNRTMWWSVQLRAVQAIRSAAPKHTILVSPDGRSEIKDLIAEKPYEIPNLVYVFHFYDPFIFTHNNAPWVDSHLASWRGVRYPSSPETAKRLETQVQNRAWLEVYNEYSKQTWNYDAIENRIALADQWAKHFGVKLICDEFGTYRPNADPYSRTLWHRDVRKALEKFGIGWAMYSYRGGMGFAYREFFVPESYDTADWNTVFALGYQKPPRPKSR